jgi:polar amino acid transport system substrate-binding protein
MENKNIIVGILAVVVIVVGAFWFLNSGIEPTGNVIEEEVEEVRPFIISTLDWEPHVYLDSEGVVRGISADLMERVFARLDVPYEIRIVPWARALREAEEGKTDALMAASYSDERSEFLYYTEEEQNYISGPIPQTSITVSEVLFFIRSKFREGLSFESIEEVIERGNRVGATAGFTTTQKLYDTGIDPENIIEYPDAERGFEGLSDGEVDMYIQDAAVGFSVLKKIGLDDEITSLPYSFFKKPQYIPFSKKSSYPDLLEFREKFLEELRKIHESGEYDEIYARYVG